MHAKHWEQFICLINCIRQKCGEDSVRSARYSTYGNHIVVSVEAFERLCRGRTIQQSIDSKYNHRSFTVGDTTISALYAIPQLGATTMPGDVIELCCEFGPDDGTVISDDEAIRVLSQQTVLVAEATCDA